MSLAKGQKIHRARRIVVPKTAIQQVIYDLVKDSYKTAPARLQDALKTGEKKVKAIIKVHEAGSPITSKMLSIMNQRIGSGDVADRTPLWVIAHMFCFAVQSVPVKRPRKGINYELP